MRNLIKVLCLIVCISSSFAAGANKEPQDRKLNVVVILADDLGWTDTACYGSTYFETPNIDRLATQGIRFTQGYAANPLCSPTRASILTGKNPDRTGVTSPWCALPKTDPYVPSKEEPFHKMCLPYPRTYLPYSEYTLAEAMRDAGYRTVIVGKWHLGKAPYDPEHSGFETNIGSQSWGGPKSYFSPYMNSKLKDGPKGEYLTDRLASEAADYIRKHKDEPFFMCFWTYSVHTELQAKEEYIEYFSKKKDPRSVHNSPVMGAMIKSLDEGVGTVLDALKENGLEDNTIVFFLGDNGPTKTILEGVPVSNALPLRNKKGSMYEGGIRVPFIVRWPGKVQPGAVDRKSVVTSTDIYTTALKAAGIEPKPEQAVDSVDLIPVITQTGALTREAIFCHYPYGHAYDSPEKAGPSHHISSSYVRAGDFKLIRRYETHPEQFPDRYELFNLVEDISESKNLAELYPEKVKELDAMIDAYLKDTKSLVPKPNPAYDKKYDYLYENKKKNKLEVISEHQGPVIGPDHPDVIASGNRSGFETGQLVKHKGMYHMFVNEMFGRSHIDLRVSHWASSDAINWSRQSTVVNRVPGRSHTNPRSEVWLTGVEYNEDEGAWNIFFVSYRGGNKQAGENYGLDYDGRIWRARSTVKGPDGIAGPYNDIEIILQPDENSQKWEGQQAVDSFNPYKAADGKWYGFYGGHYHHPRGGWAVGLAVADKLSGPWKRMPEGFNPVPIAKVFIENPVVSKLPDGRYLAIFDSLGNREVGYSISKDGITWPMETRLKVQTGDNTWAGAKEHDMRTPLCAVRENDGTFTLVYTARMKDKRFWSVGKCTFGWR